MSELAAFEDFKFKIGDVVVRVTDQNDDKGMVVGRSLNEFTSGINHSYAVAFESTLCNQYFEEIELVRV